VAVFTRSILHAEDSLLTTNVFINPKPIPLHILKQHVNAMLTRFLLATAAFTTQLLNLLLYLTPPIHQLAHVPIQQLQKGKRKI
jgi:hypothetical protein